MIIVELRGGNNPFPFDREKHIVINIDWNPRGADIVADLNCKLPIRDNSVDLVYSSHCIEHLKNKTEVFWEIHRILVPGGIAVIRVPHFTSSQAWNYDHVSVWRLGSMNCFVNADWYGGGRFPKFELISERLIWRVNKDSQLRDIPGIPEQMANLNNQRLSFTWKALLNQIVTRILNLKPGLSERFLYYWVFGIDEIEYVIRCVK